MWQAPLDRSEHGSHIGFGKSERQRFLVERARRIEQWRRDTDRAGRLTDESRFSRTLAIAACVAKSRSMSLGSFALEISDIKGPAFSTASNWATFNPYRSAKW